ncbi:MAG: transcriptional repressor [Oscillospiraceae bacterium]
MNYSRNREAILNYLKLTKVHPTADIVYDEVKDKCPGVSLATVYRNLNQLSDHGIIKRIRIDGISDRFDGNVRPHDHFYCRGCGKIFDMQLDVGAERLYPFIKQNMGFSVESHDILFTGICCNCKNKN